MSEANFWSDILLCEVNGKQEMAAAFTPKEGGGGGGAVDKVNQSQTLTSGGLISYQGNDNRDMLLTAP